MLKEAFKENDACCIIEAMFLEVDSNVYLQKLPILAFILFRPWYQGFGICGIEGTLVWYVLTSDLGSW